MKYTESIIQTEYECYICGKSNCKLDMHHCLSGSSNRKWSEKFGLKIWLCPECHKALHDKDNNDNDYELQIKQLGQRTFEEKIGTREEFRKYFNKSWL